MPFAQPGYDQFSQISASSFGEKTLHYQKVAFEDE